MAKQPQTLDDRAAKYFAAEAKLQEKHNVERVPQIVFPLHNKRPWRGTLGMWLLSRCNAKIVDGVKERENGNSK